MFGWLPLLISRSAPKSFLSILTVLLPGRTTRLIGSRSAPKSFLSILTDAATVEGSADVLQGRSAPKSFLSILTDTNL